MDTPQKTIKIELTPNQYNQLEDELIALGGYQWNDSTIHADSCGSKVLSIIQDQMREQTTK